MFHSIRIFPLFLTIFIVALSSAMPEENGAEKDGVASTSIIHDPSESRNLRRDSDRVLSSTTTTSTSTTTAAENNNNSNSTTTTNSATTTTSSINAANSHNKPPSKSVLDTKFAFLAKKSLKNVDF